MSGYFRRRFALILAILLAAAGLWVPLSMTVSASPDEGGRVPYRPQIGRAHV